DYFVYVFTFLIIIVGGSILYLDGAAFNAGNNAPVSIYEGVLIISMLTAALTVLFSKSRLTAIVAVGALGYLVSLFFVIFRAPDLALTQLVVETVTTALFLLCFYHLPEMRRKVERVKFRMTNLVISIGVGAIVAILALSANGTRLFEPIAYYYENSYELAGAR